MLSPWFDASSPWAAADPCRQPPTPYVLLAPPRAGSFHLCRLLWNLGYGRPSEYLNPNPLYRQLLGRWAPARPPWRRLGQPDRHRSGWPRRHWLERLVAERSCCARLSGRPFFGLKLQAFQLPGSFGQLWPRLQRQLGEAGCGAPVRLVLLRRRNWRRMVASLHLARCTGAYDLGLIPTYQHHRLEDLLNPAALAQAADLLRRHLLWLRQAAAHDPAPLLVDHDDLLVDQAAALGRLLAWLDPEALQAPALELQALARPIQPDPSPWRQQRSALLERLEALLEQEIRADRIGLAREEELLAWWTAPADR